MPENDPNANDPLADLYGRLPDPREAASDGARRRSPSTDESPAAPGPDAPVSRRAARAARAQTGPTAAQTGAPAPAQSTDSVASTPATRTPAPTPAPRADAATPSTPPAAAQPGPTRTPAETARRAAAAEQPTQQIPTTPAEREPALVGAAAAGASAGRTASDGTVPSGSLEDLFTGRAHTDQIGAATPRKPKKRRRAGGWIALGIVLVLIGGLVGGGFALWNTYGDRVQAFLGTGEPLDYEAGIANGEARVTIVAGDTGESVSPKMFDAGVTKASNSLYKYMVDNSVGFTFQPGVYKLQKQMTSEAVIAALRDPANRLDNSVQLREGLTLTQSLDVISEQTGIARADLDAAVADPSQYGVSASSLEGWIFPATYDFDEGVAAKDVIARMVQRTVQSLDQAGVPESDRERILIIASIIEREARNPDDFYKVSRVIENRLQPDNDETHGLLQMDSTAQYGVGEIGAGSSSSSENALTSDNPWNTYIHPGLPVGPIANAGDLAIDAAMHPVDGPWYYFTTVNLSTGETVFSATYADQLKAVDQFQQWCRDNPDGGC
ncbi:endolytic transglycosylase MltG [Microbacterium testaceum]|uniref:endolytic transglycosylase MltG n=1 Tax=Microbacterium testaceum TaxID=2033 RepID=UPI0007349E70|nr:endolytic transglycosylase MltG [Microbacterium testaceum]KTS06238.1 ABC transporter substrate-binding protein [Microbacterium testaceum]